MTGGSGSIARHVEKMGNEEERAKSEKGRVDRQKEAMLERRQKALDRGEELTGLDEMERKKLATQRRWDGKWAHRRWKIDAKKGLIVK